MTSFRRLGIVADHVNRHSAMRQEVLNVYPDAKFHDTGHRLNEDELIAFLTDCDAAIRARALRLAEPQDHQQVWERLRELRFRRQAAAQRAFRLHVGRQPLGGGRAGARLHAHGPALGYAA